MRKALYSVIFIQVLFFAFTALSVADEELSYQHGMTMVKPSDQWREALPSGNGTIGALVYGSIASERVIFNHNELWYMGNVSEFPDLSAELPVVRKLMLEGDYLAANDHYGNKLRELRYKGKNSVYHPAFDLLVESETEAMFEDYRRTLDFESGEVEVSWKDNGTQFSRRLFVSIPDDISAMSIRSDKSNRVSGRVTLDIHDLKDAIQQSGEYFDPGFTYKTVVNGDFVEFRADGSDGGEFGGVVRVIVSNGKIRQLNTRGVLDSIEYESADEVLLLVAVFANEPADTAVPRLKKKLSGIDQDYDQLFARHAKLHRERFNAMGVNLNLKGKDAHEPNEYLLLEAYQDGASSELIEKLFDYGRYLLISSSRSGGYPAGLQGLWNGDYRPPWSGLYGINENLQMTYWQALPGNMEESIMAFFDYFDTHLDEFRQNAKQLWGCNGIYIPPFMSPNSGVMRQTAAHVINWTDAAGWLASFYYDYYLFSGDEVFLRERAIPFMKEVALFYEDFIVKDENGKNMFLPSQSPENQPVNMVVPHPNGGRSKKIKVQINSTIAVAISKEVLSHLIDACELLNVEHSGVTRWKQLLADMPEYQINEDGAIREWIHPDFKDNYEHRHQSHIYPLFPGDEITEESNPELFEACRVAIEKRLVIGLRSQTGWSLAHMANVYARLGDGDKALEALNILTRACLGQNFFTYHNDWRKMGATLDLKWGHTAPFQMDANFGIPAAISEMLCGSTPTVLRILPALPSEWTEGEFAGMLTRVGTKTSLKWDMKKKTLAINLSAVRDADFDIKLPSAILKLKSSLSSAVSSSTYGSQYRHVRLSEGEELALQIQLK